MTFFVESSVGQTRVRIAGASANIDEMKISVDPNIDILLILLLFWSEKKSMLNSVDSGILKWTSTAVRIGAILDPLITASNNWIESNTAMT